MQVDNPLNFNNFPSQPAFEDFFNMDLLAGPSSGAASSSRSSSSSPSNSFSPLPPTPPNAFPIQDPISSNPFFNFLDDDFTITKVDPLAPPPTTAAPFDFLGAFPPSSAALQSSSPESGGGAASSPSSGDSPVGIDPQFIGTPATAKDMSEFGDDDDLHNSPEEAFLQEMEEDDESPSPSDEAFLEQHKVGGRGKNARKGTVQSGGIVKKSGPSTASKEKKEPQAGMLSTTSVEPDDWRPTPEEYKKMSSKEKRQLRNKISARNFRVRRKEYITTLEGDIAERDRLIEHIRTELLGSKSENSALRQEIQALKKALLDGRGLPSTPVLPPPAPLSTVSAASAAAANNANPKPASSKSPLVTPNIHKDLPTSPRLGARNFWGGAAAGNLGGFGGITPVHTTLMPEWSSVLSGKPVATNASRSPMLQENINPSLNSGFGGQKPQQPGSQLPMNPFDSFADKNMFTLKTMEDYRMQLWTRMGQQQAQHRQMQQQAAVSSGSSSSSSSPSPSPSPPLNGLASNMRPHFFTSPTLSAILKSTSSAAPVAAYPSPPPSPPMPHATAPSHAEQQAILAASLASQTLVRKLGSAFWDAFSGGSSSAHGGLGLPGPKAFDADKVRKVLEGKAVVRVVDVEPHQDKAGASGLAEKMAGMSLAGGAGGVNGPSSSASVPVPVRAPSPTPSTASASATARCQEKAKGCAFAIEEKLRNMRL
ncbi:hypothetical protein EIP91_005093 [Steccherinum ochraceum]|uniref:BZIP domain-containing protein n=1 Tax=Steccherinum ochraceum TaxID=92696 RepID=A0A4R0RIR8_9APHY|nr:hypothetical protein EIP91_005093 [Steccherinum ochraceum]